MAKKTCLTKADRYYIDNNLDKKDVELASDVNRPVAEVRDYIHKTKQESRVSKLLMREKGCVAMTEGASEAADQSRRGYVTDQAIQAAVARQDFEEAARLQDELKKQRQETDKIASERTQTFIHYSGKRNGDLHNRR